MQLNSSQFYRFFNALQKNFKTRFEMQPSVIFSMLFEKMWVQKMITWATEVWNTN